MTWGPRTMPATGAISRMKLKLSLSYSVALIALAESKPEKRVAVRGRAHDRLGGDIAAGAWPVLDDKWLAEPLRQPLTHQAREDVVRATSGEADDRCAPAVSDRLAHVRRATQPAARQRPLPDARNCRRGSFMTFLSEMPPKRLYPAPAIARDIHITTLVPMIGPATTSSVRAARI